ncbi:unnamed protein product [Lampetra planeri]
MGVSTEHLRGTERVARGRRVDVRQRDEGWMRRPDERTQCSNGDPRRSDRCRRSQTTKRIANKTAFYAARCPADWTVRGARQRRKLRGEGEEEEATAIAGERLLLLRKRSYCCCCSVSPRTVRKPAELHGHRGHVAATRGARRDALGCLRASGTVERAHSTWNSNKKVSPGINHWRRVHTSHLQGPPPVSLNTRTAKA